MKTYRFRPQWIPSIFCLALFVLLVSLGRWQWQRGLYKNELLLQYSEGLRSAPLSLTQAIKLGVDVQGFPIQVSVSLNPTKTILLDNQPQGAQAGFQVLSLAKIEGEDTGVLVERGWMPWTADRAIPFVELPRSGKLEITGQIYFPSDKQLVLKEDDFSQVHWPLLVQKLDLPAISRVLGVELAPLIIRVAEGQLVERGGQLPRKWPQINMGPEKHRAYAFQWFGMALVLLMLFMVFSTEKYSSSE